MSGTEGFIKFLKDVLGGTPKVLTLSKLIRIAPSHMPALPKHSAYNAAAFTVAAFILILSVNYMSPSEEIGLGVSAVALVVAFVLFSVLGFFVNLLAGTEYVPEDDDIVNVENSAVSLANKWATYAAFCFTLALVFYALIYSAARIYLGMDVFAYCALEAAGLCSVVTLNFGASYFGLPLISAFLGTSVIYLSCLASRKVMDGPVVVMGLFVLTVISLALLVHVMLFVAFV